MSFSKNPKSNQKGDGIMHVKRGFPRVSAFIKLSNGASATSMCERDESRIGDGVSNTFHCNIWLSNSPPVAQHGHDLLLLQGGRVYSHGGDQGEVGLHQQCQIDEMKINPAFLVFNCHYHKLTLGYFNFKSIHGTRTRPQRPKWPLTSLFVHGANTSV